MLIHTTLCNCRYSPGGDHLFAWLTNPCSSSDLMLSTCSYRGLRLSSCFHSMDVAVTCNTLNTGECNYIMQFRIQHSYTHGCRLYIYTCTNLCPVNVCITLHVANSYLSFVLHADLGNVISSAET
jgi:hypothetical protein